MKSIDLEAYFYANYSLVASTQPERLHRTFDVITSLFDRVGLWTNTAKMVSMVLYPCHTSGEMSEEAYERRMMGKGPTFQKPHHRRVEFP